MKKYIRLARPYHYIKNFLLFLPLIFSENLLNPTLFFTVFLGFFVFNFSSSVIYIINDIFDAEKDKLHPKKRYRPIASGAISKAKGLIFAIILLIIALIIHTYIAKNSTSWIFLCVYLLLNFGYSIKLKQIPILDILILVSGFLIRVLYGGAIINVPVSNWLYLTIICVSFYLGLGKRRNELSKQGSALRKVLKYYTYNSLNIAMYLFNILAISFYVLWCTSSEIIERYSFKLLCTLPLVLFINIKYSLNINGDSEGDPVEVIIQDKILIVVATIYALIIFLIIYPLF